MEWLVNLFTNENFLGNLPGVILFIVAIVILGKVLHVRVHTSHVTIGGESKDSFYERKIIQEQCDFTHEYLMGLVGKIRQTAPEQTLQYGGWFTKCILETIYDEIVRWITYNHISEDEAYISTKQTKVCAMIYTFDVLPPFKTPEFQDRVKRWVEEVIHELVRIRKVYLKEAQGTK